MQRGEVELGGGLGRGLHFQATGSKQTKVAECNWHAQSGAGAIGARRA